MEKGRGTKLLTIFAICMAIIGMTVGFASLSTVLEIKGTGKVNASNWSVVFENLEEADIVGTAVETTTPTIKAGSTTIGDYAVELMTPGDSISYTFKIKNKGTYDAEINAITIAGTEGTPFVVSGGDTDDQTNVKNNLSYTLTYVGGANDGHSLAVGDALPKKVDDIDGEVSVKLTLTYLSFSDATLLPKEPVTIDNLGISINYGQA